MRVASTSRPWLALALAGLCAAPASAAAACTPDPLGGRALYLRGTFNSWNADETQKFTWACSRWELVTTVKGEHNFKVADEAWSTDADFGQGTATGTEIMLLRRGPEIKRRFDGVQRFTVSMNAGTPQLKVQACPATAPLADTVLYLRGTPNNWAALDDYAFQYSCDAYYLNVKLSGRQEFKVADASSTAASTFGEGNGNFAHVFDGEHTVRLGLEGGQPRLTVGPLTFANPSVPAVADPVALSLRFDSRSLTHKMPFGAVPAGTRIDYAVTALPGIERLSLVIEKRRLESNQESLQYTELARLPMQRARDGQGEGARERFSASHRYSDAAVYGHWFEAVIGGKTYVLQNNAAPVFWTREKGAGGVAAVADMPASPTSIRRFRQTVFDPAFKVPDWARDVVFYVVFPDRFRNGDPRNDSQPGTARYHQHTVEKHADWNQRPYRPNSGDGSDAHFNNDFFGGDLAGLTSKLDYIKKLGANTIYMTPVFKASSNHKYDTADYRHIDPAFGSNADFTHLTRAAAQRGLRVIVDTSLNHTGADSLYFNRYGNFGTQGAFQGGQINPASPWAGWYSLDATQSDPDKQFKGWVGVSDLPELNKSSASLRDFFFRDRDSVMKLWLDRGAAGWRMDVAPWVPDDFWREWRRAIKAHRPDALTVAETWFDASKYFLGDMFDSTMNYVFRSAVLGYAAGGRASVLYGHLEHLREAYPPQALFALMNLLSSHDQPRALHALGWHDDVTDPATIALAKQRLELAVFFQMTYPGAPAVYYGDEVGVTGGDDPHNRSTYPWADRGGAPDTALLAEFKKLIKLRRDHAVLRQGSLEAPLYIDDHVIVWLRRHQGQVALVALNNAPSTRSVALQLPADVRGPVLRAAHGGATLPLTQGRVTLELPAMGGRVWVGR